MNYWKTRACWNPVATWHRVLELGFMFQKSNEKSQWSVDIDLPLHKNPSYPNVDEMSFHEKELYLYKALLPRIHHFWPRSSVTEIFLWHFARRNAGHGKFGKIRVALPMKKITVGPCKVQRGTRNRSKISWFIFQILANTRNSRTLLHWAARRKHVGAMRNLFNNMEINAGRAFTAYCTRKFQKLKSWNTTVIGEKAFYIFR